MVLFSGLRELRNQIDFAAWTTSNWEKPHDLITAWMLNTPRGLKDAEYFIACRVAAGIVLIGRQGSRTSRPETRVCAYMWQGHEPLVLELLLQEYKVPIHEGIPKIFKKTDRINKQNAGDSPTRKDGGAKQMLSARLRPRRQSKGQYVR